MRLDRLEISGFKSFPDRADVAFDAGVTAIVGPNGCGKSNLVDAITWVLGEQSAKSLRGDRMEDVIFSGSDARKATGAAEVRLRLTGVQSDAARRAAARREGLVEAGDGAGAERDPQQIDLPTAETRDVEIARRLYRSGESEYLIDGEGCRLRDVQDLLMDAGLGVKAYAVIEQGKIGQILSAKPTERRQLIEEAAGVTKYKSRRRAAELKLEAAQQNLTRVDDIVFEIERQRTALKRQAARARRYGRLREELRRWEKMLFARRYRVLSQQVESARARLAEAAGREAEAGQRVVECERQAGAARAALLLTEEQLTAARERMHARELDHDRHRQQLDFCRQQIGALDTAAGHIAAEIAALEARRAPLDDELASRRAAARQADDERLAADVSLADAEQVAVGLQRSLEALEGEVEGARSHLSNSQNTIVTLQYAIERAQEGRDQLGAAAQRLERELHDLLIETQRLRAERETAAQRLAEARTAVGAAREARSAREAALAAARADREQRLGDLRRHERDQAGLAARLRSLEEIDAHRQGYGDAARLVLTGVRAAVAHHGAVADYLEADPEHERVVEALLGDLLQCILVPDHDEAQRGLAHARDEQGGRLGFLVTSAAAEGRSAAPDPGPGIVPVTALVQVSGPHREAILAAMRDVWVADSAERARAWSARSGGPVATSDGDVYRDGLVVFGGVPAAARGILPVKRAIRELRPRVEEQEIQGRALEGEVFALEQTVTGLEQGLADLAAAVHQHEKTVVSLELQAERTGAEIERCTRQREQISSERRQIDEERTGLEARESEARGNVVRLEGDRGRWQEELSAAQRRLGEVRETSADALRHAAEAKAQHAALVERTAAASADVRRLEETRRELEERIAHRRDDQQRAAEQRRQLGLEVTEGERREADAASALASLREVVEETARAARDQQRTAEIDEDAVRGARGLLEEARADLAKLEVTCATTESDLHHLAALCLDTLQATLDEVSAEVGALEEAGQPAGGAAIDLDEEDAESEPAAAGDAGATAAAADLPPSRALAPEEAIAELRAKIDRLGPVNLMAIEQFAELEERHTFLSVQRKDLIDSIAATGEAIKRIDRTTRERFREAFAAINRYFEETFTTLFGGGRAGLVLLDEDDLLESGIDVIAQPPGKRLQNVQLLSGGEKALTAMALMFGIFKCRPSPFCLLDEIDAPLDDVNVARFIEMLRGMQENTQFVLVTHHRRTMEIADRLYGVTMEEPGVSKLISLRLN
jgi:chromosome segregation protein